MGFIQQRLGPLPLWAWAAIGLVVVLGYMYLKGGGLNLGGGSVAPVSPDASNAPGPNGIDLSSLNAALPALAQRNPTGTPPPPTQPPSQSPPLGGDPHGPPVWTQPSQSPIAGGRAANASTASMGAVSGWNALPISGVSQAPILQAGQR